MGREVVVRRTGGLEVRDEQVDVKVSFEHWRRIQRRSGEPILYDATRIWFGLVTWRRGEERRVHLFPISDLALICMWLARGALPLSPFQSVIWPACPMLQSSYPTRLKHSSLAKKRFWSGLILDGRCSGYP